MIDVLSIESTRYASPAEWGDAIADAEAGDGRHLADLLRSKAVPATVAMRLADLIERKLPKTKATKRKLTASDRRYIGQILRGIRAMSADLKANADAYANEHGIEVREVHDFAARCYQGILDELATKFGVADETIRKVKHR